MIDFVRSINGGEITIKRTGKCETTVVENKPIDENGVIDIDFLLMLDTKIISEKIRNIHIKGEISKASQLRKDSWIINDLCHGADIPGENRFEILESIDRILNQYLSEDRQDDPVENSLEEGNEEVVDEQSGLMETSTDPKMSEAAAELSSDDEFYDCLECQPYDPVSADFWIN